MPIVLEIELLKHHLLQAQILADGDDPRLAQLRRVLEIGVELAEEMEYRRKACGPNVYYLNDFLEPTRRRIG